MSCLKQSPKSGFSLIEILVVIAIIVILCALLIPALGRSREASRKAKAHNDIKQLETALRGYYDEYHRWPMGLTGYDVANAETTSTGIQTKKEIVQMLAGAGDVLSKSVNPKQIPFLEVPKGSLNANGDFVDPWDVKNPVDPNCYKYMMDFNGDNELYVQFNNVSWATNLFLTIAVWSRGKDQKDEVGFTEDNIYNW